MPTSVVAAIKLVEAACVLVDSRRASTAEVVTVVEVKQPARLDYTWAFGTSLDIASFTRGTSAIKTCLEVARTSLG